MIRNSQKIHEESWWTWWTPTNNTVGLSCSAPPTHHLASHRHERSRSGGQLRPEGRWESFFFLLFGTMEPWPISSFPEQLQYSFSCFILRNLRWLLYKQKLNMWYVWLVYAEWEYLFFFWLIPPGNLRNMVHWVWRSPSWWRQFQRVAWMVASTNGI